MTIDHPPKLAPAAGVDAAGETLSQFLARVLNQLSLSAWLPSALMVLGLSWIFALGSAHKASRGNLGYSASVAVQPLARISVGGALLLFAGVVIATMLTQAFSFNAIQLFEGYWGMQWPLRQLAAAWTTKAETRARGLREERQEILRLAFGAAEPHVRQALVNPGPDRFAVDPGRLRAVTAYLEGTILGGPSLKSDVTKAEALAATQTHWRRFAPHELLRRLTLVEWHLEDHPAAGRCLPTKLGNVLRAWEDRTNDPQVRTLVLRQYDNLTPSVRSRHDQYRNRLDLYGALAMVAMGLTFAGALAVWGDLGDVIVMAVIGSAGVLFSYRAAITSARVYGVLLVDIASRSQDVGSG
ncbi:MAG: hypothetical protein V9G19_04650 [Tetrasphaera sp.]